jgi:hypothetical protein
MITLNMALANVLALGHASVAAAQDTNPSRLKHNRENVRACRQEAIDKNIPRRNRAVYEKDCLKKTR